MLFIQIEVARLARSCKSKFAISRMHEYTVNYGTLGTDPSNHPSIKLRYRSRWVGFILSQINSYIEVCSFRRSNKRLLVAVHRCRNPVPRSALRLRTVSSSLSKRYGFDSLRKGYNVSANIGGRCQAVARPGEKRIKRWIMLCSHRLGHLCCNKMCLFLTLTRGWLLQPNRR